MWPYVLGEVQVYCYWDVSKLFPEQEGNYGLMVLLWVSTREDKNFHRALTLMNGCFLLWLALRRRWWLLVTLTAPPSPSSSPGFASCCSAPQWADLRTTTITLPPWPPPHLWSPRRSWAKAPAKGRWRKPSRLLESVRRTLHHHGINVMGLPIPFRWKGHFDVLPHKTLSSRATCSLHFPQDEDSVNTL